MYVANLENCKRLYELSGWMETSYSYSYMYTTWKLSQLFSNVHSKKRIPAYDAGYLLRKLSSLVGKKYGRLYLEFAQNPNQSKQWYCSFVNEDMRFPVGEADTPEDALALLCIKLIEEGILNVN